MIHTEFAVRTLQAVAITVGVALFLWSTGLPTFFHTAEAVSITSASDTLTNSAPGGTSVHTIAFNAPTTITDSQIITVDFPTAGLDFDLSSLVIGDISITIGGDATGTAASADATDWGLEVGSDFIQFTNCTTATACDVTSASQIVFTIGVEGNTLITNPTGPGATTSYEISIGNTPNSGSSTITDGGYTRIAIVDEVTVSASVQTTLQFTVSGVNFGGDANGSPTTTSATTTSIALPFGNVADGVSETLAQRLNVTTNALNGYTVTVEQTGELISGTGADINGFVDGSYTQTPTAWQGPSAVVTDDTTFGHWGLTSTDGTTTRSADFEQPDTWVSGSTTPIVIMGHTGPSDGITEGVGSSTIGYQIEISALQEAGDDYSTTLRYIATPTF